MRLKDRAILAPHSVSSWIEGFTDDLHLTTDPACVHYRPAREGTRLDRISRGVSCTPCMVEAAWKGMPNRFAEAYARADTRRVQSAGPDEHP